MREGLSKLNHLLFQSHNQANYLPLPVVNAICLEMQKIELVKQKECLGELQVQSFPYPEIPCVPASAVKMPIAPLLVPSLKPLSTNTLPPRPCFAFPEMSSMCLEMQMIKLVKQKECLRGFQVQSFPYPPTPSILLPLVMVDSSASDSPALILTVPPLPNLKCFPEPAEISAKMKRQEK